MLSTFPKTEDDQVAGMLSRVMENSFNLTQELKRGLKTLWENHCFWGWIWARRG